VWGSVSNIDEADRALARANEANISLDNGRTIDALCTALMFTLEELRCLRASTIGSERDLAESRAAVEAADVANLLEHTRECLDYAARTGKTFCIGPCSRLRRREMTAAEYLAEVKR
jgi:hypothetical protein